MGVEQPQLEVNRLPPSVALMVWTRTLHFYVGYTASPESIFPDITLALQGYCFIRNQPPASHGSEDLKILFKLFPPCQFHTSRLPSTAAVVAVKRHSGPLIFKVNIVAPCLIEQYDFKTWGIEV